MMFSRNVFCGATKPRRPPGILAEFAALYRCAASACALNVRFLWIRSSWQSDSEALKSTNTQNTLYRLLGQRSRTFFSNHFDDYGVARAALLDHHLCGIVCSCFFVINGESRPTIYIYLVRCSQTAYNTLLHLSKQLFRCTFNLFFSLVCISVDNVKRRFHK